MAELPPQTRDLKTAMSRVNKRRNLFPILTSIARPDQRVDVFKYIKATGCFHSVHSLCCERQCAHGLGAEDLHECITRRPSLELLHAPQDGEVSSIIKVRHCQVRAKVSRADHTLSHMSYDVTLLHSPVSVQLRSKSHSLGRAGEERTKCWRDAKSFGLLVYCMQ